MIPPGKPPHEAHFHLLAIAILRKQLIDSRNESTLESPFSFSCLRLTSLSFLRRCRSGSDPERIASSRASCQALETSFSLTFVSFAASLSVYFPFPEGRLSSAPMFCVRGVSVGEQHSIVTNSTMNLCHSWTAAATCVCVNVNCMDALLWRVVVVIIAIANPTATVIVTYTGTVTNGGTPNRRPRDIERRRPHRTVAHHTTLHHTTTDDTHRGQRRHHLHHDHW